MICIFQPIQGQPSSILAQHNSQCKHINSQAMVSVFPCTHVVDHNNVEWNARYFFIALFAALLETKVGSYVHPIKKNASYSSSSYVFMLL